MQRCARTRRSSDLGRTRRPSRCVGRRSYGNRCLDPRVRVIALDTDVLEVEGVDLGDRRLPHELRQRPRLAGELQPCLVDVIDRTEEHTSELQSLMRISYAVFCLKKKLNCTR